MVHSTLDHLRRARIFFGHQSVGANILEGVAGLKSECPAIRDWLIQEISDGDQIASPGMYHARVGRNRDIPSKFAAFEEFLCSRRIAEKVDMAFMKLCYVDINKNSNVQTIFNEYCNLLDRIQIRFPRVQLMHCTIPLTIHGGGIRKTLRDWIKGDLSNVRRGEFNSLLVRKFGASAVIDIAQFESLKLGGGKVEFKWRGMTYAAANKEFTSGAGHLNEIGSRFVAGRLLHALNDVYARIRA